MTVTGITLVTGLGRCGTSLLMQMLDAGGYPILFGQRGPAYEQVQSVGPVALKMAELRGGKVGALKWLAPHERRPPAHARAVMLTRNHYQQARSSAKFTKEMLGEQLIPNAVARLKRQLASEERRMRRVLRAPRIDLTFEELIDAPRTTLQRLAVWLEFQLDVDAAAAVMVPRPSKCVPYLLEHTLSHEATVAEESSRGVRS